MVNIANLTALFKYQLYLICTAICYTRGKRKRGAAFRAAGSERGEGSWKRGAGSARGEGRWKRGAGWLEPAAGALPRCSTARVRQGAAPALSLTPSRLPVDQVRTGDFGFPFHI